MAEVGQTSLAVVPNMRGFRQKVNAESRAAARGSAKGMASEFGRTGVTAGRSLGQGFRRGSVDAERALQDLTRANASATRAWSTANRNHENALGRVRVAQAKLGDAVSKYGQDSTQAIVAQERLASAQRRAEETGLRLTQAQARLADSTRALKAAQDAAAGGSGGRLWGQLAKDLQPVTSRLTAVRDRMRDVFSQSRLGRGMTSMWDGITNRVARATVATFNFGQRGVQSVTRAATGMGQRLSGAFNNFLAQSPRMNTAFTRISDGARAIGRGFLGAGQMLGGVARAAGTVGSTLGRALGPGLSSMWSGLQTQIGGAARALTGVLGGAAVAAGAIVAGALTKAFTGGFSRLSNIENAEAKMRGLGFSAADIDSAMEGASNAVDGTAFALDEMATAASQAMSAGLKPGEELNGYMATLKNAAAAANTPLSEMGSILNKTVTSGRAYTMEINQIADRGLPIWSKLAEAYGVTADEMRDMVSRGEVDAETFLGVMDEMTGTVADEMGGTTQAAIRNFGTAINKLGADMLQGLYPVIGPLFEAMKSGVQMIQTLGAPAFEAFGEVFAPLAERLTAFSDGWTKVRESMADGMEPIAAMREHMPQVVDMLQNVSNVFSPIIDGFTGLGSALAPVIGGLVGALGPLLSRVPLLGRAFSGLTGPVGIIIGIFIAMWQQSEQLRDAVMLIAETLIGALAPVFDAIGPIMGTLGEAFGQIAGILGDVLATALMAVVPLIEPLVGIITTLLAAFMPLMPIVAQLAETLGGILVTALTAISPLFGLVAELLVMLTPIITMVGEVVAQLLMALMPLLEPLGQLIGAILPVIISLFMAVLPPIMSLVQTIISALMPIIQALITTFTGLINFVTGVFTGNWQQAWNGIKGMFQGFVDTIRSIASGIGKIFTGIVDTIKGIFSGIGTWLVDSGRALIQGFIDGIKGMIGAVGDAVGSVVEWARDFLPFSPAKRGPLSGAGWTRLRGSGRALTEQWISGIDDGMRDVNMADVVAQLDAASRKSTGVIGAHLTGAAGRGTTEVRQENHVTMVERDPRVVFRQLNRELEVAL